MESIQVSLPGQGGGWKRMESGPEGAKRDHPAHFLTGPNWSDGKEVWLGPPLPLRGLSSSAIKCEWHSMIFKSQHQHYSVL